MAERQGRGRADLRVRRAPALGAGDPRVVIEIEGHSVLTTLRDKVDPRNAAVIVIDVQKDTYASAPGSRKVISSFRSRNHVRLP